MGCQRSAHALLHHAACALGTKAQLKVSASLSASFLSGALLLLLLLAVLSACRAAHMIASTLCDQISMQKAV
jgi:hypothetical protein